MWLILIGLFVLLLIVKFKKQESSTHKKDDISHPEETQEKQGRKESEESITASEGKAKNKSKGKKETDPSLDITEPTFIGSVKVPGVQAIDIQHSKMLVSTSNSQLHLYDLKEYKKENPGACKKGYQHLDNNVGTAVWVGAKYLYVALNSDKTVAFYEFIGQNGVYFKLVARLPKSLHVNQILGVCSDDKEQVVVTVGSDNDTTIKVWSHKGDKLHELNTSQVKHYGCKFYDDVLCLRSWSPSFKLFKLTKDKKTLAFSGIDKFLEMSHNDGVLDGSVDILGSNGVTIRKDHGVCVWKTDANQKSVSKRKEVAADKLNGPSICEVHSVETEDGRVRTLSAFSDGRSILLTDTQLNIRKILTLPEREKDAISCVRLVGKKSLVVCGATRNSGRVYMWNVTEVINETDKLQA